MKTMRVRPKIFADGAWYALLFGSMPHPNDVNEWKRARLLFDSAYGDFPEDVQEALSRSDDWGEIESLLSDVFLEQACRHEQS